MWEQLKGHITQLYLVVQIFHATVRSNRFTHQLNWDKNQVKENRLAPKNLLKSLVDRWKIHLTWRNSIYIKGLDRKVRKVWLKKWFFLSFHPTDHKITRLSQCKKGGWASCFSFTTVWRTFFLKRKVVLPSERLCNFYFSSMYQFPSNRVWRFWNRPNYTNAKWIKLFSDVRSFFLMGKILMNLLSYFVLTLSWILSLI